MTGFMAILSVIAKHVQKHLGDKSLNELIAQGIAVYLEVVETLPSTRELEKDLERPPANTDVVIGVIEELLQREE